MINIKNTGFMGKLRKGIKLSDTAFSLVEIMVVVGIIVVLVALTIPNFLRSRIVATEGAALANLKSLLNVCQVYYATNGSYPDDLTDLIKPTSDPPYIDEVLAAGTKQNYTFTYNVTLSNGFTINADPAGLMATLNARHFYTDETGVIRVNAAAQAGPGDPAIM